MLGNNKIDWERIIKPCNICGNSCINYDSKYSFSVIFIRYALNVYKIKGNS